MIMMNLCVYRFIHKPALTSPPSFDSIVILTILPIVAERSLYYWNSEHLCVNVLSNQRAPVLLPYVYGPLSKHAAGHWNSTVETLAQSVLKMYMDLDVNLYDKCNKEYLDKERNAPAERAAIDAKWLKVKELAMAKGVTELTDEDMKLL